MTYRCMQCAPCRAYRRRLWTGRILLEAMCHEEVSFHTLTFDEKHLPPGGELSYGPLGSFLKRVRSSRPPESVRYYAAGELGERSGRPHYHCVLFGVPHTQDLSDAWGEGFIHTRALTPERAGYVCKYITKADGAVERSWMSRRPGIGASAVSFLLDSLRTSTGYRLDQLGNFVARFRYNGRFYPLGRYIRGKCLEAAGLKEFALAAAAKARLEAQVELKEEFDQVLLRRLRSRQMAESRERLYRERLKGEGL